MQKSVPLVLGSALALVMCSCSGGGGNPGGTGGGSGGGTGGGGGGGAGGSGPACPSSSTVEASSATNYKFWSKITCPITKVKPMADLTFDWSGVDKNLIKHPLDAKQDLKMMSVLFFDLSIDEYEEKLNADTLATADLIVVPPLTLRTDGATTKANLLSFTLNGTEVTQDQVFPYFDADFYDPPTDYVYALTAASSTVVGMDIEMVQCFQLDKSSTNTEVKMTGDSIQLDFDANLHELQPIGLPAGKADITFDWSKMTTTAMGGEFDTTAITRVLVGHYNETRTELEDKFLDIEVIATDLFEGTLEIGTKIDLSTLKTEGGKDFSGIDDTGTWIVALQCGNCRNPAPWYLTILEPCGN